MPILTADMWRVVTQQWLGYVATVRSDGTLCLSPKGRTYLAHRGALAIYYSPPM
jgi:hypothetical protein